MANLHIDIRDLIAKCQVALVDAVPTPINYADKVSLKKNELPTTLGQAPINIYALWVRANSKSEWVLKYIGQRSTKNGWGRVKQHLFSTPAGTQSKLQEVKNDVQAGAEIGVTAILVKPDSMRLAIEEELINLNSSNSGQLLWNKKARAKRQTRKSAGA